MGGLIALNPGQKLIWMGLGEPIELFPWILGGLTELISLDDGSACSQEIFPLGLGQPTELVPVDVGWADRINSLG